ncbi:Far upstream element-binding protein 2 [Vitis vinifera]|uniref:Far upstream element-binding protein 2 n=1 Tax=Vitis vinifera TaxID=29760 RepID=A0A438K918_VITVI|nr:Far upstream element-binding protein 2 [Vitis vinifera]
MAEEVQYSSGTDATNKRKYEDQTTPSQPSTRRPTGFSAPISTPSPDSSHAPPSYNSVPPPADEIQLAKQRAQEIAARLFSNASNTEAKRLASRMVPVLVGLIPVIRGSALLLLKPMISTPSAIPVSYGYQGTSKKIDIPNGRVGVIIGKGGETIKYLQLQSGAKIQVTRDMDADPNSPTRLVELMGTPDQIAKAEQLINDVLSEAEAGGSGIVSRRLTGQAGSEQFVMKVPNNKVGLIIGKGGETIKNMQARTGARIQVIPLHLPPGDTSMERTVQIDGTSEQIESAKQLVNEVISEWLLVILMNPLVVSISSSVALLPLFGLLSSQRLQIIFPADPAEGLVCIGLLVTPTWNSCVGVPSALLWTPYYFRIGSRAF